VSEREKKDKGFQATLLNENISQELAQEKV